jgi:lysophospholipase-2
LYSPLKKITSFGDNALVNAWFNINSFEKAAHLEKVDEEGMLSSIDSGTPFHKN